VYRRLNWILWYSHWKGSYILYFWLWTAVRVVMKGTNATTIYRRINENLLWLSVTSDTRYELYINRKVSQKPNVLHTKINWFGKKSGESVKVKIYRIWSVGSVEVRKSSYILTLNTRQMTPHLLKCDVPFKSYTQNENLADFLLDYICIHW